MILMVVELIALAAVLIAVEGARRFSQRQSSARSALLPLPPGPKPLPFIGNVLGMNRDAPHLTYMEWSKIYGDIVHTNILGQTIIVLNSEEAAVELLEKRSKKYSDRPAVPTADIFGLKDFAAMARYGPTFRLHRRLFHQVFHANAAVTYRPRQLQKAYEMIIHLLENPSCYAEHFTTFSSAVVMEVTYGYNVEGTNTYLTTMKRAADFVAGVTTPEIMAICTAFPFVLGLPAWFPGMGFKSAAPECRRLVSEAIDAPYAWTQRRVAEGNATPSMVADAIIRHRLDDVSSDPELVHAVKWSAGTLYTASVETTNATLITFVYFMMNHPETQRRAQAEIDRVVGRQRLPKIEDRGSLPYVDAVLRETMRCHPVVPMGAPHAISDDDVYRGYHIPRGSMIVPNIWAISHNELMYPNPDMFTPERFLLEDGTLNDDDVQWAFGFGRRICPGMHIAVVSLWSAMVCMLAMFKIEKMEGSDNVTWTMGLSSHPIPFPCRFVPRDEEMDGEKLSSLIDASRHGIEL